MEEQIKILNEKIDKLQATIDKMAEYMQYIPTRNPNRFAEENSAEKAEGLHSFIGGGSFNKISDGSLNSKS